MNWLLDDGPFGDLALHFDPSWTWPASTVHLVREVADSAASDRSGRRSRLLQMSSGGPPSVAVHDIVVPSPASRMLYEHLRRDSAVASDDRGEHASIALCARQEPEFIFVANDKKAAFVALVELGPGRVAAPFDVWDALRQAGLILVGQFEALCARSARGGDLPGVPLRFAADRPR